MSECVLKTLACRGLRVGPSNLILPALTRLMAAHLFTLVDLSQVALAMPLVRSELPKGTAGATSFTTIQPNSTSQHRVSSSKLKG